MLKFFCDLTDGRFAAGFRDRSEQRPSISQDNDLPFRLYLLQSLRSLLWPFSYHPWSGAADITVIISLRDPATAAVLASTPPLNQIKRGFESLLHTNTLEVAAFLSARPTSDRGALLSVDLIDGSGNKINPFRAPIILRANPAGAPSALGAVLYFPEVTDYLGSGPGALQSKATVGRTGAIFEAVINGILVSWRIEAGTADTDVDLGIIKPLDFDSDTNPVNLVRVGGI